MTHRILIVDDERVISETVEYALSAEGFVNQSCTTGAQALELVSSFQPDLVILDVGLPDRSGFEICKDIRRLSSVPVIFLTARNEEIDRVLGLEIGADDYVAKPFSPRELVSRVKVILKRTGGAETTRAKVGRTPFLLDERRFKITFYEKPLDLSKSELGILSLLVKWPGRVFSRAEIMDRVWENPDMSLERTIDSHIKALRAKIEAIKPGCAPIVTHRGLGYSLREDW